MTKGWSIAEIFMETGVSGSVPLADRPEGKRLWAVVQPGDVIIAAHLDRAFRDAELALETVELLKNRDIGFHVVDPGGDSTGNVIPKLVLRVSSESDHIAYTERATSDHVMDGSSPGS
jgi:putative DNA-invertase from lambdoid prophage Rac